MSDFQITTDEKIMKNIEITVIAVLHFDETLSQNSICDFK